MLDPLEICESNPKTAELCSLSMQNLPSISHNVHSVVLCTVDGFIGALKPNQIEEANPQAQLTFQTLMSQSNDTSGSSCKLLEAGNEVLDCAKNSEDLQTYLAALDFCKENYGEDHVETINAKFLVARLHLQLGRNEQALLDVQDVLKAQLRVLGPEYLKVACTLELLSRVYDNLGEDELAMAQLEKTLAIFESQLGPSHVSTANLRHRMAVRYARRPDGLEKAQILHQGAAATYNSMYGVDDRAVTPKSSAAAGGGDAGGWIFM